MITVVKIGGHVLDDQAQLDRSLAELKEKYDRTIDGIRRFAAEQ